VPAEDRRYEKKIMPSVLSRTPPGRSALASARGLVSVSRMMPEDSPSEEQLIRYMVSGVLAYLDLPAQA
jgi:hypothetical protein